MASSNDRVLQWGLRSSTANVCYNLDRKIAQSHDILTAKRSYKHYTSTASISIYRPVPEWAASGDVC